MIPPDLYVDYAPFRKWLIYELCEAGILLTALEEIKLVVKVQPETELTKAFVTHSWIEVSTKLPRDWNKQIDIEYKTGDDWNKAISMVEMFVAEMRYYFGRHILCKWQVSEVG